VDGPVERSIEELIAEAEEAATGRIPASQFVASLDWSLPRISQRCGDYAAQSTLMIADALDRLGVGRADLTPTAARALGAAAAVAGREGHRPEAVGKVHNLLVSAGLAPAGPAPEPRPKTVRYGQTVDGGARVPDEDPVPADPALDPEVARAAARVAPPRSSYQSLGLLGLGWAIAICVVGGLLGGVWLDGRFGTSPILTGLGTIVGLALAYLVFREMLRQSRA
jgi:hypothetical protein